MPLSSQQRTAINRENASRSTGPKSDAGKAKSARNAVKHGARADAKPLPNEDPAAIQARNDAWNDYYKPQSPGAQHLVNQCVQATLMADRVHAFHQAMLAKQIREVAVKNDQFDDNQVLELSRQLRSDPRRAVTELAETAPGCRWMMERWGALKHALICRGRWTPGERNEAIRLQGYDANPDTFFYYGHAWLTSVFSALCNETRPEAELDALFHPTRFPEQYQTLFPPDADYPPPSAGLVFLHELIDGQLATLREKESELRNLYESPARDEAPARALILRDPTDARLFLRYHSEARTSFQRFYSTLLKTLEADADASETASDTPAPEPAPTPEPVSPNEANSDATPSPAKCSKRSDPAHEPLPAPRTLEPETVLASPAVPAREMRDLPESNEGKNATFGSTS